MSKTAGKELKRGDRKTRRALVRAAGGSEVAGGLTWAQAETAPATGKGHKAGETVAEMVIRTAAAKGLRYELASVTTAKRDERHAAAAAKENAAEGKTTANSGKGKRPAKGSKAAPYSRKADASKAANSTGRPRWYTNADGAKVQVLPSAKAQA
jgi:hypothetical protein